MGIQGAALGTVIAEYLGAGYITIVFFKSKKLTTRPGWTAVKHARIKSYFTAAKLGINIAMEDFAWNIGNPVLIRILNAIDEYAAGIYTIVFSVALFVFVCRLGVLGVFLAVLADEFVRAWINLWKYLRIVKRWKPAD